LNVAEGLVGYVPEPKFVFRVRSFRRFVTLNTSTRPSARTLPPSVNARLTRRLRVKKSLPMPALRWMKLPSTIGRHQSFS